MKIKSSYIGVLLIFLLVFSSCSNKEVLHDYGPTIPELTQDFSFSPLSPEMENWREVPWFSWNDVPFEWREVPLSYAQYHIDRFVEAGLSVDHWINIDKHNDFHGILCRGECIEKALFTDANLYLTGNNAQLWSAIEVYPTKTKAIQRKNELASYLKETNTAHEYLYINGTTLLILSRHFTENQVKAYEAVFMLQNY